MTYEELQNKPKMMKVIFISEDNPKVMNEMLGGIYEVRNINYNENNVAIWNKDKTDFWYFKPSYLQEVTPLTLNGYQICVGDTIETHAGKRVIYEYYWYNGEYWLNTVRDNDFENGCLNCLLNQVANVIPLHQETSPVKNLSNEALIKELEARNLLVDGKVLK